MGQAPDDNKQETEDSKSADDMLRLTSDIVTAYLAHNPLAASDVPAMIKTVHATLGALRGVSAADAANASKPMVPVKRSVTPDYIVCLEDGKKLKMLKRYLRANYKMTPEEYRAKWGLPADYPMVAPNYAQKRSEYAKQFGLGRAETVTKKKK